MATPESIIEKHLVAQAKKQGFLCFKFTSPGRSGVPDRVLIGHGHTIFVELKAPGETPRRLQEVIIQEMRDYSARVDVIDSQDLVDELLTELTSATKPARPKKPKAPPSTHDCLVTCRHRCPECRMGLGTHLTCDPLCVHHESAA
jgi:hypothetical protein